MFFVNRKNELILPEDTAQGYQSSIRFYFLSAMLHSRRPSDISQHICQHSKSQAIALDHNKIHDQDQTKLKQKKSAGIPGVPRGTSII